MAIADRIAVLSEGRLRQVATPAELYQRPVDAFVADFVGTIHSFDVNSATEHEQRFTVSTQELGELTLPASAIADGISRLDELAGQSVIAVRPEHIGVSISEPLNPGVTLLGRLGDIAFQGQHSIVEIMLDNRPSLTAIATNAVAQTLHAAGHGSTVWAHWDAANMLLLPNDAGADK